MTDAEIRQAEGAEARRQAAPRGRGARVTARADRDSYRLGSRVSHHACSFARCLAPTGRPHPVQTLRAVRGAFNPCGSNVAPCAGAWFPTGPVPCQDQVAYPGSASNTVSGSLVRRHSLSTRPRGRRARAALRAARAPGLRAGDALARQVELVPDRLERPRLALEAEPQLQIRRSRSGSASAPSGCSDGAVTPQPRRTDLRPRGRRRDRRARPRRRRRRSGSARPMRTQRRAPLRRAGAAGRLPRPALPSSARGRAPPRGDARRATASAGARRHARARGSCARGSRPRAAPTGGSTRWRTSELVAAAPIELLDCAIQARAFLPGSDRGTAAPSAG